MEIRFLQIAILILCITNIIIAGEAEQLFESANNSYKEKQYIEAIENYEQLVNKGYQSEELFYNLGNAYFRVNKLGLAILNYEKALKISPLDEDIKYNLAFANSKTVDKIDPLDTPFFLGWWHSFINVFSVNGWTLFAYLLYFTALAFTSLYFFSNRSKLQRIGFFTALITGVLFLFTVAFTLAKIDYDNSHQYGIVTENIISAKLSPDNSSGDAFVIHEGAKVILQDDVDNWVRIKLADGKVGWININTVKVI